MNAATIARIFGGKKSGGGFILRCIVHEDRSPSLSIADGDDGRLLVRCHAGCDPLEVLAELRRRGLAGGDNDHAGHRHQHHHQRRRLRPNAPLAGTSPKVAAIWNRAAPIAGTLAERYLRTRGCAVPRSGLRYLPPSVRFQWPTMVALVTDFVTGIPTTLHFTALAIDGSGKAPIETPRRPLAGHRKQGGVIRLTADSEVTTELGIGEGIETCLAVAKVLGPLRPIWSAIDAGNLAGLPVVPGIDRLVIYSDTDPSGTGQAAARTLATRWHQAGREVYIAQPPAPAGGKSDWNERPARAAV
jgi:putative DNA primase/helicase